MSEFEKINIKITFISHYFTEIVFNNWKSILNNKELNELKLTKIVEVVI